MKGKSSVLLLYLIIGIIFINPCKAQLFNEQGLKFMKLFGWLETQYVDSVDLDKLSDNAIKEFLHTLDPHSVYFSKDEVKAMNEPLQGNFEGIGITYSIFRDTILVISSFPDGPSEKAGIKAGDRIIKIDSVNVAGVGMTKQLVQNKLRGNKGTVVNIELLRRNKGILSFTITRDKIPIKSIDASYKINNNTGYIRLSRFAANSDKEISSVFKYFKSDGIENIILDLRGNTGGYLDIAVSLADEFLENGKKIVYTIGTHSEKREYFSTSTGLFEKGKLVVIIDENSASASEIFAGAIQDWDKGVIIGRRSYGKGLVQRPFTFPDGSMVRLTIARYYTPSGRLIQKSYSDGYKAYNKELNERVKSGEIYGNEKKNIQDSVKYYTQVRKRIVFGGGGILPDIYMPIDTNRFSKLHKTLMTKDIFRSFALDYIDFKRDSLKIKYSSFSKYNNEFQVDNKFITGFIQYCSKQNIKIIPSEFEKSKQEIIIAIRAYIAWELWSISEFYEIFNTLDPDFLKAAEVIENWDKYSN